MFDFLKTIVQVNTKLTDLEADLMPTADCIFGGEGEIEFESFENGTGNIEFELKRSSIPDGTVVEVLAGGNYIGELTMQGGRAKQRIAFDVGQTQPELVAGDIADMVINGQVCYRGQFHND